ncbi:MAG: glycosyltransferase, partial [Candidatus Hydrogenedentales bacterium]
RPNERFDAAQFGKIVAGAQINLNLHASQQHAGVDADADAVNPRVFEIAACGGFQLCDACRGIETLFDVETEVPVYRDLRELRLLIRKYLDNPDARAACAARARTRTLAEHTYDRRARQMLDALVDAHGARMLHKGVKVQRTVGELRSVTKEGGALGDWLSALDQNTPFTYEALAAVSTGVPASYPEQLFAYLRQVRETGESALAGP